MASKDLGVYREATGGTSISGATATVLTLDTTEIEDAAFTINGSRNEVTVNEDCRVLAMWGGRYGGTDSICLRVRIQVDTGSGFANVPGNSAYLTYTNDTDVDEGGCFGATILSLSSGDKIRIDALNMISTDDASVEAALATSLQLLRLADRWHTCVRSKTADSSVSTSWAEQTWDASAHYIDTDSFEVSGNGIKVLASGRYLLVTNLPCKTEAAGPTEGCVFQWRGHDDGVLAAYTARRCVTPHKQLNGSRQSVCHMIPMDILANHVVTLERRAFNAGDATDTQELQGAANVFALVKLADGLFPEGSWMRVRRTATTTGFTGTQVVDWNTQIEADSGWLHSTSVNPSRVTPPSSRILIGCFMDLWRTGALEEHSAHDLRFREGGSSVLPYGEGGTGANLGDPPSDPKQRDTSMQAGALIDSDGTYLEVVSEEIGTLADASTWFEGGVTSWGALFWGIDLATLTGDDQTVSLGAASATATVPALAVSSELSVALGAASATATVPALVVAPGALSVGLGAAAATAVAPSLSVSLGALTVSLGAASATAVAPAITVLLPGGAAFYRLMAQQAQTRWKSEVATPRSLTTQYDNMPFTVPASGPWARLSVEFTDSEVVQWGQGFTIEAQGLVRVILFGSAADGSQTLAEHAAAAMDSFREVRGSLSVGDNTVRFYTPREVRRELGGAYLEIELEFPFRGEQTAPMVEGTTPLLDLDTQGVGEALQTVWASQVEGGMSLPTHYDGIPFSVPTDGSAWARIRIVPGESNYVDGTVTRTAGVLLVQVFTPAMAGSKTGWDLVDGISRVFRHRTIQGLRLEAPDVGQGRESGAWWQHNMTLPWVADIQ